MNNTKFRKSIRLKEYDYSMEGAYFITICTYDRECMLGNVADDEMLLNQFGNIVLECWNSLTGRYTNIELDKFVVMPNHIHGIIKIIDRAMRFTFSTSHESPLQNRKALDDIVLGLLGLTREERKEVYWVVCGPVKSRLEKTRSV
ncbi:MAG: hypothetical protein E3K37_02785 [Candidatus Kuenenia sp.]|nr:hypothetical protein [Candidatus Kuenenia hertensis]